jgi:hypothetical protein
VLQFYVGILQQQQQQPLRQTHLCRAIFFCRENDYGCKLTKRFSRRAHMRAFSQEEPAWLTSAVKIMTWYAVKIRILLK